MRAENKIKFVGILSIIIGFFKLLRFFFFILILIFLPSVFGDSLTSFIDSQYTIPQISFFIFSIFLSILWILGGIGVLKKNKESRIVLLIVSILSIFLTLSGSLVFLFSIFIPEVQNYFFNLGILPNEISQGIFNLIISIINIFFLFNLEVKKLFEDKNIKQNSSKR
jgi:hypothetical protein